MRLRGADARTSNRAVECSAVIGLLLQHRWIRSRHRARAHGTICSHDIVIDHIVRAMCLPRSGAAIRAADAINPRA
jgi:hypothetical protein